MTKRSGWHSRSGLHDALCKWYAAIKCPAPFLATTSRQAHTGIRRSLPPDNRGFGPHSLIVNRCGEVMKNLFQRFVNEEAGQDLIEYALLAGLISLVCVLAITNAGTKVSTLFTNV